MPEMTLNEGLQQFLEEACQLLKAERGIILTPDDEVDYIVRASVGFDDGPNTWKHGLLSHTIINRIATKGEPLIDRDAMQNGRFLEADSVQLSALRSVVGVPIKVDGALWGVLYMDNNFEVGIFKSSHMVKLVEVTASLGEVIKEHASA